MLKYVQGLQKRNLKYLTFKVYDIRCKSPPWLMGAPIITLEKLLTEGMIISDLLKHLLTYHNFGVDCKQCISYRNHIIVINVVKTVVCFRYS